MDFTGKVVVITGATGLIGSELVTQFTAAGAEVISAVRNTAKAKGRYVKYDAAAHLEFDFRADYVIHAACSAHPMAYSTDPAGVMRANITGTMNLLDYAVQNGSRFIFLSSGEIYGNDPISEAGFTESETGKVDTMNPRSCYPESKRAAETMVAAWAKQYGCDALVARLCHVYGPAITDTNSRADAQFLRNAVSGQDIIMKSAGTQVRSFMYVKDAARAIMALCEKGNAGEAYNVSSRASVASIREYAGTLANIAGVKLVFENPDDVEAAGYSKVSRAVLDPAKLESLGFVPEYDLEKGLKETFERWAETR
ncbi:MAG: NAD(P)-dependent oxidoreductase [Clostridia bacterium]|nr:NAD(P)-dependent oxidoreductase [Clostridia bacterium]